MFEHFKGYQQPTISQVNKKCVVAMYIPLKEELEPILGIKVTNTTSDGIIYLKSNTLINISNTLILKLLNTLPKIKNKRVSKRKRKGK